MNKEEVETFGPNVIIDACPTCKGIWLDEGELGKQLKDKKLAIELNKPFQIIKKGMVEIRAEHEMFEPLKNRLEKAKTGAFTPVSTHWLRGWDLNPQPLD